jgi:hypothetical protein
MFPTILRDIICDINLQRALQNLRVQILNRIRKSNQSPRSTPMFASSTIPLRVVLMGILAVSNINPMLRVAMIQGLNTHMSTCKVGNESICQSSAMSFSNPCIPTKSNVSATVAVGNTCVEIENGSRLVRPLTTHDCNSMGVLSKPFSSYTTVPIASVTGSLDVWETELVEDFDKNFLLDGIRSGFSIVDSNASGNATYRRNYKSTQLGNKMKVEKLLLEEIEAVHYIISEAKPLKVSALGAVPKDLSDIRVIHDLSRPDGGVNAFAVNTSVAYVTLDKAVERIPPSAFLAKLDLKAAYRSIPIKKECFDLTGIQWKFSGHSKPTFIFDARLPFGAAMSCAIFQRVTDSIARMMERRGFTVIPYLDDMLCVSDSENSCKLCLDELVLLVESLGLHVNWKKSFWSLKTFSISWN